MEKYSGDLEVLKKELTKFFEIRDSLNSGPTISVITGSGGEKMYEEALAKAGQELLKDMQEERLEEARKVIYET